MRERQEGRESVCVRDRWQMKLEEQSKKLCGQVVTAEFFVPPLQARTHFSEGFCCQEINLIVFDRKPFRIRSLYTSLYLTIFLPLPHPPPSPPPQHQPPSTFGPLPNQDLAPTFTTSPQTQGMSFRGFESVVLAQGSVPIQTANEDWGRSMGLAIIIISLSTQ